MPWIVSYTRCWVIFFLAMLVEMGGTSTARGISSLYLGVVVIAFEWAAITYLRYDIKRKTGIRVFFTYEETTELAVAATLYTTAHMAVALVQPWALRFLIVSVVSAAYMAYHHVALDDLLTAVANRIRDQNTYQVHQDQ